MQSDHTTEGAMKAILDEMEDKLLLAMQSDKGTEMCAFQWLPNNRVIHFFTCENGNIKCAMVECFQQTLQGKMHHHMMANRTQHFMHVLLALLHTFNATHHSTIDMVPRAVNRTKWVGECLYLPRCLWYMTGLRTPIPRDWVRMSKSWSQLTKGYTGHWSKEILHIEAVQDTSPMTYNVSNAMGQTIKGTIYELELQKVMLLDYFDVEAILDMYQHENRTQYFVKWVDYPASFNSSESYVITAVGLGPHGTPKWSLQHLLPSPWSLHCLRTPARTCT